MKTGLNLLLVLIRIVFPLLVRGIGYAGLLMARSLIVVWKSINESSKIVATDWLVQVGQYGMDSRFDGFLYWMVRGSVYFILAVGWLFLSYLLVWVTGIVW